MEEIMKTEEMVAPEEPIAEKALTPPTAPKKTMHIHENRVFHIVNYILLTLIVLLCLVPFVNIIAKALSTYTGKAVFLLPHEITWYNFSYVFTNWPYFRSFLVSAGVTLCGTALSVGVMFAAAYALSKQDFPLRKGVMVFFIIIMLFSGGIVPNFFVMKMLGLLNTPLALVFPSVVQVYNLILLKNYVEGVPREIEESAHIDGATNLQVMVKILIPVSLPAIASVALFTAVTYWNNYFNALIYLSPSSEQFYPLALFINNYINSAANELGDLTYYHQKSFIEMAMIIVSIIPILAVYPFVAKFFVRGVTVGSVKG